MNPQFLFFLSAEGDVVYRYRPLLDMDLPMFVNMIPPLLSFILTAAFLTWLLYKPVKKILQARADRVEGDINDAALSKASAAELKAMYEQKVREIETERAEILDEARKAASERRAKMLDEAKAEAQDVKERAARDVANELEQIKGTVHQAIVDISTDMAAKLISASVDAKAHEKLFDEAMAELEATTAIYTEAVTA
ncbi:MAG: F0F1 ATP synthase subunit B [Defluviitaleaceae bacterium]|nr:F0F1 ATP synthase subunit B [Defluviitaleaceae bacterium]